MKYPVTLDLTPEQIAFIKHKAVDLGVPIRHLIGGILTMCLDENLIIGEEIGRRTGKSGRSISATEDTGF